MRRNVPRQLISQDTIMQRSVWVIVGRCGWNVGGNVLAMVQLKM